MTDSTETVLVTGATGFVARHCIAALLAGGYRVRGTLRNLARGPELVDIFAREATDVANRLTFCQADLGADDGWAEAANGCSYVLHVASPMPAPGPQDADAMLAHSRGGTLRVLEAAAAASVRRVVMTSSTSAILYGHARDGSVTYDEKDWSLLTQDVGAYERSKTLTERAAWAFIAELPPDKPLELVTINAGVVLGPLLGDYFSVSGEIVRKLLTREMPGCPDLGWAVVDVRDLAQAHIAALSVPAAAGQRIIAASEHISLQQIAQMLSRKFTPLGYKVPVGTIPGVVLKLVALVDKTVALTVPELGKRQDVSSARARELLGWKPRSVEQTVVDMAESMISHGLVAAPKTQREAWNERFARARRQLRAITDRVQLSRR